MRKVLIPATALVAALVASGCAIDHTDQEQMHRLVDGATDGWSSVPALAIYDLQTEKRIENVGIHAIGDELFTLLDDIESGTAAPGQFVDLSSHVQLVCREECAAGQDEVCVSCDQLEDAHIALGFAELDGKADMGACMGAAIIGTASFIALGTCSAVASAALGGPNPASVAGGIGLCVTFVGTPLGLVVYDMFEECLGGGP